ncbi:MAG: ferritin-like domain-containing protein [Paludisphaera borealis]|uniref:YciE/YciF ferroxidase family protein n=1 Tax=Paludisphaera borealis TaxID=1387353 RepID=UPI00283C0ED8|nr:ferritin-like domain-containing protein [Paludisphaera borealis]MDR3619679.1 ferritin-like domain-containing protein [Paludisphaera borealis]
MKIQTLSDLMIDLVRDMFDAEKQLIKALPKMVRTASSPHLRRAFETHMEETKLHVHRLEEVLELLGQPIRAKKCRAMQCLLDEGKEFFELDAPADVKDAALIAAAQKIEHYEIASYGSLRTWAGLLGEFPIKKLLGDSLAEEKRTDELLTEIAENVVNANAEAVAH